MTGYRMGKGKASPTFDTTKRTTKKIVMYAALLLPALVALPLARTTLASPARADVRHTIVAESGAAAPAGGNYAFFLNARLGVQSEVAFDAILTGPSSTGVFVGDGRATTTIALGGNPDPAAGNFGSVLNPFITTSGNVLFDANLFNIFSSDRREIVPLVENGDPAPGGGTVTPLAHVVNDRGMIAWWALVGGSTATHGIFRTDGTQTVAIARDDTDPPTGGRFVSLAFPVMNDRGQVAFYAEMDGGTADYGIFRGEGGSLMPIFVANQITPAGGIFTDFGDPVINVQGQIAVSGALANSASSEGLFLGDGTSAVAIALEGQPAPKGGTYVSDKLGFRQPTRLNDRGEVAFHAGLTGGTSTDGIFLRNPGRTTTVALAGTVAPGTTGTFESFSDIKLGNDGRVAFIGTLATGVGGVDSSDNMGIWAGTSEEDLQLVVRTGEVIGGKVLTGLPTAFNQFDMNEYAVVWIGTFQSSRAVVFSPIPGENLQAY